VKFFSSWNHDLGKKDKKDGIKLIIDLKEQVKKSVKVGSLEDMFSKVGKGLYLGWKVEANVE
jgi:retrograde regulation protein 2